MATTMLHMPSCKDQNQDQGKKILLLSRFTERSSKFQTSSLKNKVYKANSDHLDKVYIKPDKKAKKSVLTLPNEPNRIPQEVTVSGFIDSVHSKKDEEQKIWRNRCLLPVRYNKSANQRMIKKDQQEALWKSPDNKGDENFSCKSGSHDVWALLRNMNRFQFQPSPPMSDHSIVSVKKNKNLKKNRNTRIFETCHTEEIEYTITSYDLDTSLPKSKTGSTHVGQDTSVTDIFSCKEFKKNNKRAAILTNVNKNIKAAPDSKLVLYNRQLLIDFKNNDQGDVRVDHNQSTETLKNKTISSTATLTQSVDQISIGSANSSKFYSNVENPKQTVPRKNINKKYKYNEIETNKRKKITPMDKRTVSPKISDNAMPKYNKNNEKLISHDKSNNFKRNQFKRSLTYKVDDLPHNGDTIYISPEVEITRSNKVKLATDNTNIIFDNINSGRVDGLSSVAFSKTKCSNKVNLIDAKRKLVNMKFPIVITGRDQISPVRLNSDNFCQFSGVDTQCWPFMMEWTNKKPIKCIERKYRPLFNTASDIPEKEHLNINKQKKSLEPLNHKSGDFYRKTEIKRSTKAEQIMSLKTDDGCAPKSNRILPNLDKKYQQKSFNIIPKIDIVSTFADQSRNINFNIIKNNKMTRFLQKKSTNNIETIKSNNEQLENICSEQDLRGPMTKIIITPKRNKKSINAGFENNLISSKGKISKSQTVIRNDRSDDSLQNHNNAKPLKKYTWAKAKWANDVIVNVLKKLKNGFYYMQQTQHTPRLEREHDVIIPIIREDDVIANPSKITISKIPGFDVPLPALEVESLSMKEIAIKQLMTNLTIRFDVVTNSKLENTTGTVIECTPSEVIGLPDTIKCNTTILNTILPAELCSVVPKIIRKFSENNLKFSLSPVKISRTEPQLATIRELVSRCESGVLSNLRSFALSADLEKMFTRTSYFRLQLPVNAILKIPRGNCSFGDVTWIKKVFSVTKNSIPCIIEIPLTIHLNKHLRISTVQFGENNVTNALLTKNCKYTNCTTVSTIWKFATVEILKIFIRNTQPPQNAELMALASNINYNICNNIIIRIPNLINQEIMGFSSFQRNPVIQRKYCPNSPTKEGTDKKGNHYYFLCKIKNLEEFLQILGPGLINSKLFDEQFGKRIMLCITKMRKWVDKIDIKQAMLIVLLANRCDTQDIIKFGPKLLKYVAQNVITNTSQLEKEIDAINHRKMLNGEKKASSLITEKQDLYQECYCIARSAAKHSNGTFDEKGEEKLKRFLEKRRQLNPSFLKAMSTYLGLGLLTIDLRRN